MKLQQIMSKCLEVISADASIVEAANKMARADIGFLPVLNEEDVVGTITDRDIVIRCIAEGRDPASTRVESIMSEGVTTLPSDADIESAARIFKKRQIRRLVIQDKDGAYVGVVTLGDMAQRTHEHQLTGETLDRVCEPSAGVR